MTHPLWRQELKEKLIPAEQGLFRLKEEYVLPEAARYPGKAPRFVLSGEISSIYKKDGKTRKVHSLILLPGFHEADAFAARLEKIGNIHSDGRPILGLPCHDLLEIMLEVSEEGMYIPAHIWTPHFSLFGAKSGFDTIEECFEELTPYIHALETGLIFRSGDELADFGAGRLSAGIPFGCPFTVQTGKRGRSSGYGAFLSRDLWNAVQKGKGLEGTIEFFPEEGKYHYDGHRKCGVCLSPTRSRKI